MSHGQNSSLYVADITQPFELFTQIEILFNVRPTPKVEEHVATLLFGQWQAACHTLTKPHNVPIILGQVT